MVDGGAEAGLEGEEGGVEGQLHPAHAGDEEERRHGAHDVDEEVLLGRQEGQPHHRGHLAQGVSVRVALRRQVDDDDLGEAEERDQGQPDQGQPGRLPGRPARWGPRRVPRPTASASTSSQTQVRRAAAGRPSWSSGPRRDRRGPRRSGGGSRRRTRCPSSQRITASCGPPTSRCASCGPPSCPGASCAPPRSPGASERASHESWRQLRASHASLRQLRASQVDSASCRSSQVAPDHELPVHGAYSQAPSTNSSPVQVRPFQVPPSQADAGGGRGHPGGRVPGLALGVLLALEDRCRCRGRRRGRHRGRRPGIPGRWRTAGRRRCRRGAGPGRPRRPARRARRRPWPARRRPAAARCDMSRALTWSGVSSGRSCSSSATWPATKAVACEVPLPRKKRSLRSPSTRPSGLVTSAYEPGHAQRDDRAAGGHDVGAPLGVAAVGEVGHDVVGAVVGAAGVDRAHREDVRAEGGHEQVVGLETVVAGGGHDDDAGPPRVLHRAGERVDLPGLERDRAVGQGDDADVHAAGVAVLDDPVEGGDHLGDVDASVAGADLHVEQLGLGGDPGEVAGLRVGGRPRRRPGRR